MNISPSEASASLNQVRRWSAGHRFHLERGRRARPQLRNRYRIVAVESALGRLGKASPDGDYADDQLRPVLRMALRSYPIRQATVPRITGVVVGADHDGLHHCRALDGDPFLLFILRDRRHRPGACRIFLGWLLFVT
jgi:hypothetical protein